MVIISARLHSEGIHSKIMNPFSTSYRHLSSRISIHFVRDPDSCLVQTERVDSASQKIVIGKCTIANSSTRCNVLITRMTVSQTA